MKCALPLAVCLLLTSSAWGQRSSYDPAAKQQNKAHDSFVDFALKQINPQNTDYGCQIDAARKLVLHETINSIDFWTVLVAFSFLVLSFIMLLHQHRERDRREIIAAEFLAQYHNALVDSRKHAEDAILCYNELVNVTNRSVDADQRSQSLDPDRGQASAILPNTGRDIKQQSVSGSAVTNRAKAGGNGAGRSESGRESKSPVPQSTADLIAQISTLQQQLTASHDREKQLQKQLSKSQQRVPSAQPRTTNVPS